MAQVDIIAAGVSHEVFSDSSADASPRTELWDAGIGGDDTFLFAQISYMSGTGQGLSGLKVDGSPCFPIGHTGSSRTDSASSKNIQTFGLLNPPSGEIEFELTYPETGDDMVMSAAVYKNVNQTNPIAGVYHRATAASSDIPTAVCDGVRIGTNGAALYTAVSSASPTWEDPADTEHVIQGGPFALEYSFGYRFEGSPSAYLVGNSPTSNETNSCQVVTLNAAGETELADTGLRTFSGTVGYSQANGDSSIVPLGLDIDWGDEENRICGLIMSYKDDTGAGITGATIGTTDLAQVTDGSVVARQASDSGSAADVIEIWATDTPPDGLQTWAIERIDSGSDFNVIAFIQNDVGGIEQVDLSGRVSGTPSTQNSGSITPVNAGAKFLFAGSCNDEENLLDNFVPAPFAYHTWNTRLFGIGICAWGAIVPDTDPTTYSYNLSISANNAGVAIEFSPVAAGGDMTAASILLFDESADLDAIGELSASSSLVYSETPDINAPGTLASTSVEVFAEAGADLQPLAAIEATSNVDFAKLNADLRAIGLLSATSVEDFSEVPDINAIGEMAASGVADSYAVANKDAEDFIDGFTHGVAQSVTGNGGALISATFLLLKNGVPTGDVQAKLYAHSGTFGTSSIPTGSALAVSEIKDASTMPIPIALVEFKFTSAFRMASGTNYVIALEYINGTLGQIVNIGIDESSPTHPGNYAVANTSFVWTAVAGTDMIFFLNTSSVSFGESADLGGLLEDIAATSPETFGATAAMNAIGEMVVTDNVAFSEVPDINATGDMTSTSPLVYGETNATLNAIGDITVTSTLLFDAAGADLQSASNEDMTATSPAVFAATAVMNAIGELTITATLVYSEVADINAPGSLTSTSVAAFAQAVADLDAIGELRATSTLTTAAVAVLNAIGAMSSTSQVLFTEIADINAVGEMTITATLIYGEAGADLTAAATGDMTATSPVVYAESPGLNGAGEIRATSAAVFSETSVLDAIAQLSATSVAAFAEAGADLNAVAELSAASGLTYGQVAAILNALANMTATSTLLFSTGGADLKPPGVGSVFAIILEATLELGVLEADQFTNTLEATIPNTTLDG